MGPNSGSPTSAGSSEYDNGSYSAGSLGVDEDDDENDRQSRASQSDYSAGSLSASSRSVSGYSSSDSDSSVMSKKTRNDLAADISRTIREQAKNGEEVMELIKTRFESTDKDKNGYIDANEFRQLLVSILGGRQVTLEDAQTLLKRFKIDTNHNGRVTYDEFVSFVSLDKEVIAEMADKLRNALLKKLEKDANNSVVNLFGQITMYRDKITAIDFRELASKFEDIGICTMTEGELHGLMGLIDKQGKGAIDLSDLQLFLEETPPSNDTKRQRSKSLVGKALDGDVEQHVVVDLRLGLQNKKGEEEGLLSQGYTRLTSNLNDKGRGAKVHLFVKRANVHSFEDENAFKRSRVTDMALSRSNKDISLLALGYTCVQPYNTNQGAWFAKKQYLWFRRNVDDKFPIIDIAVTTGKSKDLASKLWTPPFRGYKRIHGDLNRGNRGSQVFLWYFKQSFRNDHHESPHAEFIRMIRDKLRENSSVDSDADSDDEAAKVQGEEVDLLKIWAKYDRLDRGWLSKNKMRSIIQDTGLNLRRKDTEKVIDILDVNQDGKIDKEEFLEFLSFNPAQVASLVKRIRVELEKIKISTRSQVRKWFISGGSGHATTKKKQRNAKEFNRLLKSINIRLTASECNSLMGRFDRNGDGMIDLQEFVEYLWTRTSADENNENKSFVKVEEAARKLRSYARNISFPDMDYAKTCDRIFQNAERLTKRQLKMIVERKLKLNLSDRELAGLLARVGTSRGKFIEFCSSATYIDAVLNMVVDAAINTDSAKFFRQLDEDGNGKLSKEEFRNGLRKLQVDGQPIQLTRPEMDVFVQRFDQDGDGDIDIGEFLAYVTETQRVRECLSKEDAEKFLDSEERNLGDSRVVFVFSALRRAFHTAHGEPRQVLKTLFNKFDAGGEGFIRLDSLSKGLRSLEISPQQVKLSQAQLQQVFRRLDMKSTGRVNLGAFSRFILKQHGTGDPKLKRFKLLARDNLVPISEDLEAEFHGLDRRGKGVVTKQEFKELVLEYVEADLVSFLVGKFVSPLGAGKIEYETFFEWLDSLENDDDNLSDLDDSHSDDFGRRRRNGRNYRGGNNRLLMYAKQLKQHVSSSSKLEKLLKRHASNPNGKVTLEDFNDAMDSVSQKDMSRLLWESCGFKNSASGSKISKTIFDALRRRGRSSGRRGSSSSSSDGSISSGDDDSEDGKNAASVMIAQMSNVIHRAMERDGFSWQSAARLFDHDGSGLIKIKEMNRVLKVAGCDKTLLDSIGKVAKKTMSLRKGGKMINYEHFFTQVLKRSGYHAEKVAFEQVESKLRAAFRSRAGSNEDIEAQFAKLDQYGDGQISTSDLAKVLPSLLGGVELSPSELSAVLEKYDANGDGKIDLEEFANLIEFSDADIDELVVKLKSELRSQARLGTTYSKTFQEYDLNDDGMLSRREFRKCLDQILGPRVQLSNREVRKLMDRFDKGNKGKIDYRAFCELCAPSEIEILAVEQKVRDKLRAVCAKRGSSIDLKQAFKLFDQDGNGKISRREFQQACDRLGLALSEDELELLLSRFDTNGNGSVDYFEFTRFISYDGNEIEQLSIRAGRHLDLLQHEQVDPISSFEKYEGRKKPVGVMERHEFHRACKDLNLPFSDPEIAAFADLYADSQDSSKVKYRDFTLSTLGSAGKSYQGRLGPKRNTGDTHGDQVWNPDNLESWFERGATDEQRKKYVNIQRAMFHSMNGKREDSTIEGFRSKRRPRQVPNSTRTPSGLWSCPVCFYKQTQPGKSTCEMCDSPCPSATDQGANRWPHIKPLLDDAYGLVGTDIYHENPETSRADDSVPTNEHGGAQWYCDPTIIEQNDTRDEDEYSSPPQSSPKKIRSSKNRRRPDTRRRSRSSRRKHKQITSPVASSTTGSSRRGRMEQYSPRSLSPRDSHSIVSVGNSSPRSPRHY